MRLYEFAEPRNDSAKLAAISQLLSSRATDESAAKQIDQDAFINLAKQMGVNVTHQNLAQLIDEEPLKNILEPLDPNSKIIRFKGNTEAASAGMTVDQAEQVVDANAKAAMKRGMKNA